jgi:general secretion pathway protein K
VIRDRDSGIALLLVIWVAALLSAIAASATLEVRAGLDVTRSLVDSTRARTMADSGVWGAIALLVDDRTYKSVKRDGTPQKLPLVGEAVTVEIEDERAKLDVNNAGETSLRKLFQSTGLGEPLARALAGYRAARPQPAFAALEELLLVPGFTAERLARVAPFLTVHTDDWRINPTTARPEVLMSLPDSDAAVVQRYLALRRQHSHDEVALRLASPSIIAVHAVWGEPRFVTVRSTAELYNGVIFRRHAVVDLDPDGPRPYRIVAWRQKRPE